MPVIIVAVISRRGWRCEKACDRPYGSADCGPEGRAVTAGSGSPDGCATARADKTTANETLHRIVWVGAGRQANDQPGRDHARDNS
jgi:hypothetical protein